MRYLSWKEESITDFSSKNIGEMYEKGFVFTRLGRGMMQQTRSIRIDLGKFSESSENRRVIKKTSEIALSEKPLPLSDYDYSIGKLAKDFYENKFGPGIMSAQKVKEMLTEKDKSNFNALFTYSAEGKAIVGYSICYIDGSILHYSYPFYDLKLAPKDMGLGMMIRAIQRAKEKGLRYAYIGSLQRPSDIYKLQFEGIEWFDGTAWQSDIDAVKKILASDNIVQ